MTEQLINRIFLTTGLACLCVSLFMDIFSTQLQIGLFVVGALIIGVPHGALDYDIAKSLQLVRGKRSAALFFSSYLIVAGINFYLWLVFPLGALIFFLLLSVWHFGTDWASHEWSIVKIITFGGAFLALPSVFHAQEIQSIFDAVLRQNTSALVLDYLRRISPILGLAILCFIAHDLIKRRFEPALLKTVFMSCALLLAPVLFLFLYFCIYHGPRHTLHVYTALHYRSLWQMVSNQIAVLFLTLLLLVGLYWYYEALMGLDEALFNAIIILTACLTTPHMLLIEYHRKMMAHLTD